MAITVTGKVMVRRVLLTSVIGTAIEWYDFFLYATASALVFAKLFFPTLDPTVGTIAAFGTFAVGYVARPFGAIFFGHFGDRIRAKGIARCDAADRGHRDLRHRLPSDLSFIGCVYRKFRFCNIGDEGHRELGVT